MEIDRAGDTDAVTVTVGEQVTIRLAENPTTGYRWAVGDLSSNQQVVRLVDDHYDVGGSGAGAGGRHTFVLTATGAGTIALTFTLARAWEPANALDHYQLDVTALEATANDADLGRSDAGGPGTGSDAGGPGTGSDSGAPGPG